VEGKKRSVSGLFEEERKGSKRRKTRGKEREDRRTLFSIDEQS